MRILVTGAAGLLGSELAGVLAERGHAVLGMVYRNGALSRNDGRGLACLLWSGGSMVPGQIVSLNGDVSAPALGLAPAVYKTLSETIDLVVHCAAVTEFQGRADVYRAVNVEGTAAIVKFAERAAKRIDLLHVSTAYVCGNRHGPIAESELDACQTFLNGYEASKAAAERLVARAIAGGLRAAVVRPSIVVGALADGVIRSFDNVYLLFRLMAEGRIRTIPSGRGATIDLVPIDYVTRSIATIAEHMERASGLRFHLTSGAPFSLDTLADVIAEYPGLHVPRFVDVETFDAASLPELEGVYHQKLSPRYWNYLIRDPRFLSDNSLALLGETCPPLGKVYLRRLIDYCRRAGFVRVKSRSIIDQRTSG